MLGGGRLWGRGDYKYYEYGEGRSQVLYGEGQLQVL